MKWDVFIRDRLLGTTERVSLNSAGEEGNNSSYESAVSSDGRFVAFSSLATNLANNISGGYANVFVRDQQTGITTLVSANPNGESGNDDSYYPDISADGRYVVFQSIADNLVPNDSNGSYDVFLYEQWTGILQRVSVSFSGGETDGHSSEPSISADGRFITFTSTASNLVSGDTNDTTDVFIHNRQTGVTERLSLNTQGEEGTGVSFASAIAANGRYIAFQSGASNLVPDDTNNFYDIFVRDQPFATLDSNHPGGSPGSYFTLTGSYFPPTSTATITVNGVTLGDVATDAAGSATFLLHTADATPGLYTIRLTTAPYWAETQFILHPAGETHPQEGSGPIFDLPPNLAHPLLYLPFFALNH
jgi:Tol biopolymer transport system component